MKSISHPKTPSVRRRLWSGVSGGYAAGDTAPQAKLIAVKPAKLIVAVYYDPSPWNDDPNYPEDPYAAQRLVDHWFETECQQFQPG